MAIDLHMHSTFSDGVHSPTKLVELAIKRKLRAISLTDHDSLGGVNEAIAAGNKYGLEVISGCELSCEFKGRDLHILGYGVDQNNAEFQDMLSKFRETRYKRGIKIVEKLNALGMNIDPAEVLAKAGEGALGRPHIAAVLVDKGYVSRNAEAFDKYIADGGPAYVAKYKMSPAEAIRYIHLAGGLAFIAHPGIFLEEADDIRELASSGFDGVEVYHPKHNAGKIEQLEAVAKDYGLLVSGGTDYHGFTGRDMPMGSIEIPYEILEAIKKRLKEKRS
ncbi:MAG: PHP domain-containing protein [bacterium]|nr:PHP domain-containing protein [bacterium]